MSYHLKSQMQKNGSNRFPYINSSSERKTMSYFAFITEFKRCPRRVSEM